MLVDVLTHTLPQRRVPAGQTHAPDTQAVPPPQTAPHAPQF
jgi:hypothetical protein